MGFVTVGHRNYRLFLKEDEANQLYNLGKKAGVFGDKSALTRELFVRNIELLYGVHLEDSWFSSLDSVVIRC